MKKFIATLAVAVIGFTAAVANAGELEIHTMSAHSGTYKYNNQNFGVGYNFDNGFGIGGYYNSYKRPSVYAGYNKEMKFGNFGVGAQAGLVTGYHSVTGSEISVLASLTTSYQFEGVRVKLAGIPKIKKMDAVVHLSLGFDY